MNPDSKGGPSGPVAKEDEDRLGIRTGIGLKKAAAIKRAAQDFMDVEQELYAKARLAAEAASGEDSSAVAATATDDASGAEMPVEAGSPPVEAGVKSQSSGASEVSAS